MSDEEHDFDWSCPNCGKHGLCCSDEIWKFCPYCGSKLEIKLLYEEED